jgi:hypothetical protein
VRNASHPNETHAKGLHAPEKQRPSRPQNRRSTASTGQRRLWDAPFVAATQQRAFNAILGCTD